MRGTLSRLTEDVESHSSCWKMWRETAQTELPAHQALIARYGAYERPSSVDLYCRPDGVVHKSAPA